MSDAASFDFSKFVPGFDFLKNLSGTGAQTGLPSASAWIAHTLDPAELDKRIQELKTVHFWLDQNTKAVSATIQALEVQKMTLATLRGMNMSMSDLAESLKIKPNTVSSMFNQPPASTPAADVDVSPQTEPKASTTPRPATQAKARAAKPTRRQASSAKADAPTDASATSASGVDPMAWWGSLTQQFQHIANQAVQDLQRHPPGSPGGVAPAKASATSRSSGRATKPMQKGASKGASKGIGKDTSRTPSNKSKPARKSSHSAARHQDP